MEIKSRLFEKYTEYECCIPLNEGDRVVTKGKKIREGDIFLEKSESTLKKSINVPKVLNCKNNDDCENYVLRMDGEYIEKGELLAQKVSAGGLNLTKLFSPVSGVLDFSRMKQGYIDILGEERKSVVRSDFFGIINGIDPTEGLLITTDVVCVDGVVSSKAEGNLFGNLEVLGDGNTILTEKVLEDDYRGKIVWVGPYLYNRVAIELFERGAVAVLTYAMSYTQFREIGLPIMILGGFGSVHCDASFLKKFLAFKNKFVILNSHESQLLILSGSDIKHKGWFVNQYENQNVISRSTSTYGYIGKVLEFDRETSFLLVDFGKRGTSLIHIGLLDFIDL